jgi:hypothetical protein
MSLLKHIAQWIEDNSAWQIGKDLFVGHLPLELVGGGKPPDRCVVLLQNTPGAVVGDLPDRVDKPIQVWNRAENYSDAEDDAIGIFDLIHGTAGWNLPTWPAELTEYLAMVIDAVGSPAPIENPGEKGLFVFSTNYIWRIEKDSC